MCVNVCVYEHMHVCVHMCVYTHMLSYVWVRKFYEGTLEYNERFSFSCIRHASQSPGFLGSIEFPDLRGIFSKRIACHLAGTLKKRKLGCLVGKGDPVTFKIF